MLDTYLPINPKSLNYEHESNFSGCCGRNFRLPLGLLIYGFLLMGFFEAITNKYDGLMQEMPNLAFILLNNLIWCLIMAFVFSRWAVINFLGGGIKAASLSDYFCPQF